MKPLLLLLLSAQLALPADDLTAALQQALFNEEADHDLAAAIKAYQFVVTGADAQRKLTATAVFRLGECYRKLGQTNEAVAQYRRILSDFTDQTNLVTLSRQNLTGLGVRLGSPGGSTNAARREQKRLLEEEIGLVEKDLARAKALYAQNLISESELMEKQRQLLGLQRLLAGLEEGLSETGAAQPGVSIDPATGLPVTAPVLTDSEEKELKQIKAIIRDSPDLINAKAQGGVSRLQLAAESGQVKVAEFLLANGADVNANFGGRGAPLHLAARSGHKTMTELLLRHGAEVNNRDPGGSPLHYAVENGHLAVAEVLLANKADVNAKGDGWSVTGEMTPLHMAAFKGFTTVAELLLVKGAQVNSTDKSGQTPLHYAATYLQSRAIAQLLVTNKAEVNARSEDGWTPLHSAVKNNRLPVARLLVENKSDVNARISRGEFKGWTPLHLAAMYGDRAMAELLLANKAEVDTVTPASQTPLTQAAGRNNPDLVDALLAAGANVNAQQENRHTALSLAVQANDERTVSVILARKPDMEVRGENKLTVLQHAVANHKDGIAELLLQAGANPNVYYDQDGTTPLHWAVEPKRKPLVKLLLAYNANPNARNNNGRTPLDLTKSSPNYSRSTSDQQALDDIATLLKEAGADEQMQRRSAISISRKSRDYLAPWFVQGSNNWNRFTLLELIASVYAQNPPVAFPDFAHVTISRLGSAASKSTEIAADVDALLRSDDCSKDVPLEWGDVVEIPERDRKLNESWNGLPVEVLAALKKCLERKVEIVVKGEATKLTLAQIFGLGNANGPSSSPQWSMFWLSSAVRNGNVLRASSDLRRVKVHRFDPSNHPQEIILNVERTDPRTDLWLKDGDAIEVPEKDPNAPSASTAHGAAAPDTSSFRPIPARNVSRPESEPK